jgi:ABC-2 type transport system ATP-binding protein
VTLRAIRQVLQDAVRRGVTIFFSSHVLELVEKLCTRLAIITHGQIRVCGTLEEVRIQAGLAPDTTLEDVFVHLAGGDRLREGGLEFLG